MNSEVHIREEDLSHFHIDASRTEQFGNKSNLLFLVAFLLIAYCNRGDVLSEIPLVSIVIGDASPPRLSHLWVLLELSLLVWC